MNTTNKNAMELGGLSKLLFDKASVFWYSALIIEMIAGVTAVIAALLDLNESWSILGALFGLVLLIVAYYLKINFSITYDHAETMRRQAVFTNALGWPISRTQFSEWRRLAGSKLLKKHEDQGVDPDYFATKQSTGPKRLLEMTLESAFWTRHLYCYLRNYVWAAFIIALLLVFFVISMSTTEFVPRSLSLNVVLAISMLLPLILTVDLLGWGIKLNQLITAIKQVELDLENIENGSIVDEQHVLRLVAEYNCQVVSGFPIPNWFFKRHHDLIQDLWNRCN